MPIKLSMTELEYAAIYAAKVFALGLLGVIDHTEIVASARSLRHQANTRMVDVWFEGEDEQQIRVKLAKRRDANPEDDQRWYPISAWEVFDDIEQEALAVRFRFEENPTNVGFYRNPPTITGVWRVTLEQAEGLEVCPSESMVESLKSGWFGHEKPQIEEIYSPKELMP